MVYTLRQAYKNFQAARKEGFRQNIATGSTMLAFLILLFIQIAFVVFAIMCLVRLSRHIPTWLTVVLAIGFFIPDLGFFFAIGVIVYYYATKDKLGY